MIKQYIIHKSIYNSLVKTFGQRDQITLSRDTNRLNFVSNPFDIFVVNLVNTISHTQAIYTLQYHGKYKLNCFDVEVSQFL